ncbi:uncharacterized protein KD926_001389 [Aspergillus affinis]|uniref:uncharacterized protein n=1 Tax=Aspergillus affinis TaxID=1070780 RepID=UPI0022FEE063|nr:uncharacterized protein KD926_001389 [Aspergillus affinis]KAI9036695.1 hypothetical protein KD926_001389 [Aspergillus affinis]
MTVAAPPVAPVHENGLNGVPHGHHVNMSLPRFHPIAMNPTQIAHHEHIMQNHHHFRSFQPPPMQEPGPPAPPPPHNPVDHIEARLRQLEHEEASRMAARSHLLAVRKREDEDYRRMTENAEAEEEDLRRQRKRLKRESMGLGFNAGMDSPPLRPTPPRRLSETNAATTLAFFKQQSPPEPRPIPPPPVQAPPPHPPPQHIPHDPTGATSIRRKQKYTIKNVEAWGERHGRPAAHDPSGRALWKRPSDGSLVYLTCPVSGCGKSDFVTLHGFMCHLTKKHKDRSLGSQSRALEVCGIVYDPNAPLPPMSTVNRASTEESRLESAPTDLEGYQQEVEYSSASDEEETPEKPCRVKTESSDRPLAIPAASLSAEEERNKAPNPTPNTSTKQSISSIIDRDPEDDARERLNSIPRPLEIVSRASPEPRRPTLDEAEMPRHRDRDEPERSSVLKETAEAR